MSRIAKWSLAVAVGAMAVAGSARAAEDDSDIKTLLADCDNANIERSDIGSCLERAREIGEAAPSTQLQGLTARLERRAEALDDGDTFPATPAETRVADHPASSPSDSAAGGSSTGGGSSAVAANVSAVAPH